MIPKIDLDKEYGLVLEGGGAKGAYQIGAWKALLEAGVKIKGVAGTSVGALNGALICMGDYERAEELWKHISHNQIMSLDEEVAEKLLSSENGIGSMRGLFHMLGEGGVDVTPLKNLISENVDEEKIRKSPVELYVLTFSVSEFKELDVDMKELEEGLMTDLLMASAYIFPLFKNEKLHGKSYMDGGIINNVPLESLVSRGYKDIISIRIFGVGREKKVKLDEDTNLLTIAPRVNLGNILDFDSRKSIRNMKIGYYDAMRLIYGLEGRIYYIEQLEKECYYLKQLLDVSQEVKSYLAKACKLDAEERQLTRNYLEVVLPVLAGDLKLGKNWNYQDLYLAMLEAAAKMFRVQKYRIYTVPELLEAVRNKVEPDSIEDDLPAFVYVVMNQIPKEYEEDLP